MWLLVSLSQLRDWNPNNCRCGIILPLDSYVRRADNMAVLPRLADWNRMSAAGSWKALGVDRTASKLCRQSPGSPMPRTKYPFHPACTIFPQLPDDELRELADDIAANGLRNPVVLFQGKILDGRNRYLACELAGVKPRFSEFQGDDPIGWVVSQNLHRRHLTASQRAVVAFDLLPLLEKEAKQRQRLSRGRGKRERPSALPFLETARPVSWQRGLRSRVLGTSKESSRSARGHQS